ncbi:MAG: hypothetical protein WKF67_02835, partial [Rubrobacteraceae bacterium]
LMILSKKLIQAQCRERSGCTPTSTCSADSFELDESISAGGMRPLRDSTEIDEYENFAGP